MRYYISILSIIGLGLTFLIKKDEKKPLIPGLGLNYSIYIISEKGCMTCNYKYLNFIMENAINKSNTVIYSVASGMKLDISPFLTDTIRNLILNDQSIWEKYNIKEGSYYLKINEENIDTIIQIQPSTIAQSLNYIKQVNFDLHEEADE